MVAAARSTTERLASTPEPVSIPGATASETELPNQGPPASVTAWPVGAAESPLIVIESVAVPPTVVAVTVLAPGAPAPAVQL